MTDHICVSLDIETTGLSPETDDIIEVAAVKFDGQTTLDTFASLVRPSVPIPYYIQCLTGISSTDVAAAPSLDDVIPRLVSFIGHHPLVGHNLSFDLGFLGRRGTSLGNRVYDTMEMSLLLLPGLAHYSLGAIAGHLDCHPRALHRALPDAMTARSVFLALMQKAACLPPPVISEIVRLALLTGWPLLPLFREIQEQQKLPPGGEQDLHRCLASRSRRSLERRRPAPPREGPGLDVEELAAALRPGGALEKAWPHYEHREEQVRMMTAVAGAMTGGRHLLVEAGTGTGKSLAYLLPACQLALRTGSPVLVSTNTINLQEQLLHKDVPAVEKALGLAPDEMKIAVLKGRSNYLCLRQWDLLRQGLLSPEEAGFLIRLLVWLATTATGDRAEIRVAGPDNQVWGKICSREKDCLGAHCHYHQQDLCFLHSARRRVEDSHLTVVNHALLLSDVASEGRTLPPFNNLIIDEAHHLEDQATEHLGFQLSGSGFADYLNSISRPLGGNVAAGILTESRSAMRKVSHEAVERRALEPLLKDLHDKTEAAREQVAQFFDLLARFAVDNAAPQRGNYETAVALPRSMRERPAWSGVRVMAENLALRLQGLVEGLGNLFSALQDLPPPGQDAAAGVLLRLGVLGQEGIILQHQLVSSVSSPDPEFVYWIAVKQSDRTATLNAAPVETGPILKEKLFSRKDCVVLTSATLSIEGSFNFIRGRLGLDDADEMVIGSPFDYLSSTLLYLVEDIPEPDRPGYQTALVESLVALGTAAGGRTLALFTSHSALRTTLASVQPPLEKEGILALGQAVSGSTWQLVETLRSRPGTVLLGTSSFWEGVDIPGDALSVLAIARLPFPVPGDPVNAARAERFINGFDEYYLPQAVLKFRQGFGRLIRTRTDRGVVVLLDSRLKSKYYGPAFLKSLPACAIRRGPRRNLAREVRGWLGC